MRDRQVPIVASFQRYEDDTGERVSQINATLPSVVTSSGRSQAHNQFAVMPVNGTFLVSIRQLSCYTDYGGTLREGAGGQIRRKN